MPFRFNLITDQIKELITEGAKNRLTDEEFIITEIRRFLASKRRKDMLDGERYYRGEHDILHRERKVINEHGDLEKVENLPNNRIVDNQYKKMVNQKNNYLIGQPISVQSGNAQYAKILVHFIDKKFLRRLKMVGQDSLNSGIGWLFVHYDEDGKLAFKRLKPYEVIPGWKDEDHTVLDYAIRIYEVIAFEGKNEQVLQKVEVYDSEGISRFTLNGSRLIPDEVPHESYFTITDENGAQDFNWSQIPLVPFKANSEEMPLIQNIKSLQDGLNLILSNFQNSMEEDVRNTIMVLVNYDGTELAQFRQNLAQFGVVKVTTVEGVPGDLRTLQIEVNAENYKAILELFKKAIIENAMGYDAKDDRLGGNANQLNIMSMYSDIDLDANGTETEYQASFEQILYFINLHLANTGAGDFEQEEIEVIFNRDMMISEAEVIDNIQKSVGLLSDETLVAQHPWVDDPLAEIERKKAEKEQFIDEYDNAFTPKGGEVDEE